LGEATAQLNKSINHVGFPDFNPTCIWENIIEKVTAMGEEGIEPATN
jgi:hypothetical protein